MSERVRSHTPANVSWLSSGAKSLIVGLLSFIWFAIFGSSLGLLLFAVLYLPYFSLKHTNSAIDAISAYSNSSFSHFRSAALVWGLVAAALILCEVIRELIVRSTKTNFSNSGKSPDRIARTSSITKLLRSITCLLGYLLVCMTPYLVERIRGWLHIRSSLGTLLSGTLLAIFIFATPIAFGYEAIKRFAASRKPCPHGIRSSRLRSCPSCVKEAAQRKKELRVLEAMRSSRAIREEQSRKLRAEEISRLSSLWLSRAESYFSMEPRYFEGAIAELFRQLGYVVKQTPYTNDGGKDAILSKNNKTYVLECKRYARERLTGRRDLQILLAARHDIKADGAIFVTTGKFARTAGEYARENDIETFDGHRLSLLINRVYQENSPMPPARVMCLWCEDVVEFDIFRQTSTKRACSNGHEVNCNITANDLNMMAPNGVPVCPQHKSPMRIMTGRWGEFWVCNRYPRCRVRQNIDSTRI